METNRLCWQVMAAACVALVVAAPAAHAQADSAASTQPTKAALMAAARAGQLGGLHEVRGDLERATTNLTAAVLLILRNEYGVPPLPADRQCERAAAAEVRELFRYQVAASSETLSSRPPDFRAEVNRQQMAEQYRSVAARVGTGGGWCEVGGRPHPYGAALLKLAQEFGEANAQWVESERASRKKGYEDEQARLRAEAERQAAEKQRAEAERQAAERRRIEAERARIEADEKRRREQQKNRVSG